MIRFHFFPSLATAALLVAPTACFNPDDTAPQSAIQDTATDGDESETDPAGTSHGSSDSASVTSAAPTTGPGGTNDSVTGAPTGNSGTEDSSTGDTSGPPAMCEDGLVSPGEVCLGPIATLASPQADFLFGGDFDNDGFVDLLSATDRDATLHLGDGAGNFSVQPTFDTVGSIGSGNVVIADVNADGDLDLIANGSSSVVTTFLGNGDGTFTQSGAAALDDIANAGGMAPADFDGDDVLDVFVLRSTGFSYAFGRGAGTGSFTFSAAAPIQSAGPLAWGDFNGDAVPDVLVGQPNRDVIAFVQGSGDGTFTVTDIPVGLEVVGGRAASADLDGDGIAEAAFPRSQSDDVLLFVGGPGGPAAPVELDAVGEPRSALFADLTNDGRDDLVTCGRGVLASISVWAADGTAALEDPEHFSASPCVQFVVADFDDDGANDVAYHSGSVDGLRVMLAQP
ncbi:MAG: FG-GAP repeat domain-containing protein [Nannocystales bacterium]